MVYISLANPALLSSTASLNFTRAYTYTAFTVTLFLKNGPCFVLPREGVLTGLCTWRFFVAFAITNFCTDSKVSWSRNALITVFNMVSNYLVSAAIALHSLRQGLGSWRRTGEIVGKFPALIILPIFGYFTFGKVNGLDTPAVCLNWKSTFVNMATSLALITFFGLLDNCCSSTSLLYLWISNTQTKKVINGLTINSYMFDAVVIVSSVMLTILFYWNQPEEYGVLLAENPHQTYLMRNGTLLQITTSPEPMYDRQVKLIFHASRLYVAQKRFT